MVSIFYLPRSGIVTVEKNDLLREEESAQVLVCRDAVFFFLPRRERMSHMQRSLTPLKVFARKKSCLF